MAGRVHLVGAVLAALLAATVTSCSTGSERSEPRLIRVQVSGEPEETAAYRAIAASFMDAHPGIAIELIEVAGKDDHLVRLTRSFAAGDPPEVFLVNYREYSQFVTRQAVEPLEDHLGEAGIDLDDYFVQPLEAFTFGGALQCMPQNVSSLVVYYNRSLFQRAGLQRPARDWTWERFEHVARRLTAGDVRGLGIEPSIIRLAPFVWSNGGELVDDADSPRRFTLDDPASRQALEFLVSLVREAEVVPTEEEVAAQDLESRFAAGKLGMYLSSRRDTPVFREVVGLDFDVAALPVSKERAGILHSDAYCVSRGSEPTEAAFRFVGFATGEQGQKIAALAGRTVPALRSVARSNAFLDPTRPPAHSGVFLDSIPFIRKTPVLSTWPEIEDVSEEILTRAFYQEGYSVDAAIADLQDQTTELFEEAAGS